MNIKRFMTFIAILALLVLSACGDKEKEKEPSKPAATEEKVDSSSKEDITESEPPEEKVQEEEETIDNDKDVTENTNEVLNPYVEEETGGDVEVVFTNKNPSLTHHFSDKVSMTIDEYQIVHVSNMNESAKSRFDDGEEGYVLTLKMTLDNQSDEDVWFAGGLSLLSDDATENIIRKTSFVDREEWLKDESTEDASQYSKGKSFTGMEAFGMTKAQFEKLEMPIFKIDSLWRNNDTSDHLGEQAVFPLPFTEEGIKKAESSAALYPDKMVTDTIAEKELFFAKEDINQSQTIDKVKVTLNGVQYANITPTDGYKESFKNFGDGPLVALTAKFTLENNSDTPFEKFLIERKLHIDDRGTMLSQGMLEPTARGSVEPGETFEALAVFIFREDEFQIFKEFKLQIGPLADENAKRLFKEKSVTFDLPVKE